MGNAHAEIDPFQSKEDYLRSVSLIEEIEEKRKANQLKLFSLFNTDAGKEVLDFICKDLCGENRSAYAPNAVDMARRVGRAEVAYELRALMATMRGK